MEEQIKDSLKIVCNLYKHDRITEDELLTLINVITNKSEKITYYPITISDKDKYPFYFGETYCNITTTNNVTEDMLTQD